MHPLYKIHALHGFLGNSEDWTSIKQDLSFDFQGYNLCKDFSMLPFTGWAEKFNREASLKNSLSNNILMGYSLGGRLALHALLQNPKSWKAAILVSTHPGLKSEEEKIARIASDEVWAKRFENEPWDNLMNAWNAQGVFKSAPNPIVRMEEDNPRNRLAEALRVWSLGIQLDLTEAITALDIPILWVVGEQDTKVHEIAKGLKFKHSHSKLCVVANAGHRAPFEQTDIYKQIVTQFIKNLQE